MSAHTLISLIVIWFVLIVIAIFVVVMLAFSIYVIIKVFFGDLMHRSIQIIENREDDENG